jgi:hypothetical protein
MSRVKEQGFVRRTEWRKVPYTWKDCRRSPPSTPSPLSPHLCAIFQKKTSKEGNQYQTNYAQRDDHPATKIFCDTYGLDLFHGRGGLFQRAVEPLRNPHENVNKTKMEKENVRVDENGGQNR